MRLIDADALIEVLQNREIHAESVDKRIAIKGDRQVVINAPTIDAVEVVRCKDCKHHGMSNCPVWEGYITDDYMWCYFGERSE